MKLLIADDDRTTRAMLQNLARKWGYEPVMAEDGQQALQQLGQHEPPRLILLDWEMPGLNGLDVCHRVRSIETPDPPFIILLTVRGSAGDVVAGLEAGANDYISKPFDRTELRARLKVGRRMLDLQTQLNDAHRELRSRATHDPLTGLLNRSSILEELESEIARTQRAGSCLCIGLCDLDHFKKINDAYGHLAGDTLLRDISHHMRCHLRPYDKIARFGGEEFLILTNALSNSGQSGCRTHLERLRASVQDARFLHEGVRIPVTMSIGGVCFQAGQAAEETEKLLSLAEAALNSAKSQGRNRTVVQPPCN